MTDIVRETWLAFTDGLEGGPAAPVIYQDIRGKVTAPYGLLCDSAGEVAAMPLEHPDGRPATAAEKIAAFNAVKNDPLAARLGWRHAAKLTTLRFSLASMIKMALARFDNNDRVLHARLADFDSYPACARLAFHSLAWACGANCHYPRLFADAQNRDWEAAAIEIHINEYTPEGLHNTGVIPRNKRNEILMRNAARVDAFHLDPELINWDAILGVQDADTQPDIHLPSSLPPEEPGSYAAAMQSLAELAKFNASPVRLTEDTSADHPTRAPKAADYLSPDPDDDAA